MKRLIKFLFGLAAGATVAALVTPKSGREMREQLLAGVSGRLLPSASEPQTLLEEPASVATPAAAPEPAPEATAAPAAEPAPWFRPPAPETPLHVAPEVPAEPEPEPWLRPVAVPEPPADVEPPSEAEAVIEPEPDVEEERAVEVAAAEVAAADEEETPEPERPAWSAGVAAFEAPIFAEPPAEEVAEVREAEGEDLRPRIEETRAAVETEIAQPFSAVEEPVAETSAGSEPALDTPVDDASSVAESVEAEQPTGDAPVWPVAAEEADVQEDVVLPSPLEASPLAEDAPVETGAAPVEERAPAWDVYEEPVPEELETVEEPAAWEAPAGGTETETVEAAELDAETPSSALPVSEAGVDTAPWPATDEPLVAEEEVPEAAVAESLVAEDDAPAAAIEEPPVGEPAAAAPVAEEPVIREDEGEGAAIDQAEMRRRIEETRARLKAKAFDAMMSGEASLLSRDSGEKPVPEGSVDLDSEAAAQLEEGLSPDDS